jgi:hypothetical protein
MRIFHGVLSYKNNIPELVKFKPEDLSAARIRADVPNIERVDRISSISNDFSFPLVIPLPGDSLILSRQVRGKIFYDFGKSHDQNIFYKAGGLGLSLPIGGELAGLGSLALTRFSALTVLYSDVGGDVSRQPRFLFDISGEL